MRVETETALGGIDPRSKRQKFGTIRMMTRLGALSRLRKS